MVIGKLINFGSRSPIAWWKRFLPKKICWKRVLIPLSTYEYCFDDYGIDTYEVFIFGVRVYYKE